MYKIINATSDSYITNKYINNFRVTDSNVGSAGTLDLYKLYNENPVNDGNPVELSRILLKFDLEPIREIHQKKCNIDHDSFKVILKMSDIYGGQTTPNNFIVSVYPLSQSFDEGFGRDVVKYKDLGSCNFITASILDGNIHEWNSPGANMSGKLNDESIDIIATADFGDGAGEVNIFKTQNFITGKEDLEIDITKIVSGTITNQIPDCGFRISFSQEIEQNQKTYFVKRFASRNAQDPTMRPRLIVKYDDTIHDHHRSMNFNISGSLFLNNFVNGQYSNILSASTDYPGTLEELSGNECMYLKIFTGSYSKKIAASSHKIGDINYTGIYSSSFLINKFDDEIKEHVIASGSINFTTVWTNEQETLAYHSGSITLSDNNTTSFSNSTSNLILSVTNLRKQYYKDSVSRFRVFIDNVDKVIKYVKVPREKPSEIYYNVRYAVIDVDTGKFIIPFEKDNRSTLLSVDSDGMYFDIDMSSLPEKRVYKLSFILTDKNEERIITNTASVFRVV